MLHGLSPSTQRAGPRTFCASAAATSRANPVRLRMRSRTTGEAASSPAHPGPHASNHFDPSAWRAAESGSGSSPAGSSGGCTPDLPATCQTLPSRPFEPVTSPTAAKSNWIGPASPYPCASSTLSVASARALAGDRCGVTVRTGGAGRLAAVRDRLASPPSTQYRQAVLADAPTAYWSLDERGGTVATDLGAAPAANGTYYSGAARAWPRSSSTAPRGPSTRSRARWSTRAAASSPR